MPPQNVLSTVLVLQVPHMRDLAHSAQISGTIKFKTSPNPTAAQS